jgi:hypothetical protein
MAGTGVFAEVLDGEVYKYYADGEWRASASGKTVAIVNPTTRQTQYRVQGLLRLLLSLVYLFCRRQEPSLARAGSPRLEELLQWLMWTCLSFVNSFDAYEADISFITATNTAHARTRALAFNSTKLTGTAS